MRDFKVRVYCQGRCTESLYVRATTATEATDRVRESRLGPVFDVIGEGK